MSLKGPRRATELHEQLNEPRYPLLRVASVEAMRTHFSKHV